MEALRTTLGTHSVSYRGMLLIYLYMATPCIDTTSKSLVLNSGATAEHSLWQGRRKGMKAGNSKPAPLYACKIKPFSVGQLAL